MAVIETWFEQDLQKPVKVRYIDGNLFSHNGNGNRIGVIVTNNGEAVTLTGTVSGYAVLADGTTVPCTGTRSGNKASILVPAAAYSPGSILISIFLTDGTTVTTLAALSSSVIMARTDNQISPGSVVTDWTNTINAAMQSVETAAANLGNIVATPYANLTFPVPLGKYTIYNNGLYRCISPIASSEAWTAAHWTNVKLGDEVTELKSALDNGMYLFRNAVVDLKNEIYWQSGAISSSGVISGDTTFSNIYTPALLTFPVKYHLNSMQVMYLCKYKQGVFVSRIQIGPLSEMVGNIDFDSTFDSYRIMITWFSQTEQKTLLEMINAMYYFTSNGEIDEIDDEINNIANQVDTIQNGVQLEYIAGVIGTDGNWSAGNNDNFCTLLIDRLSFQKIEISCDNGYQFCVAKYNNGVFDQRTSWYYSSNGIITLDNSNDYRINIAKTSASGSTLEEMLMHFRINVYGNDIPTLRREIESSSASGLGYLNRISCCYTGNKICHYSVDDVYAILKDLTDNANTYTSIFDNSTLASLLSIHNDTGMCITLNTFNLSTDDASYSISNVPQKAAFQAEFQANKNWLKFAFHAENTPTNYNTDTGISAAYDVFVSAIYKLTGDYDCIDRITRLGYFGGNLENVLTIKNKEHGIIGLLCADTTTRASYYLSAEQNEQVQQKGMCLDLANELIFIKTITRNLGTTAQDEVKNNLCYQKYVEFFSHEYETVWLNNCRTMCQWAKDNGYVFAFPSLIFDLKDTF